MNLDARIEAILFWKAEPVSVKKLASILEKTEPEIKEGIAALKNNLTQRGLTLIELDEEVTLGTSKDLSPLIEKLTKEELVKDLGKAGLETLSIILYQGPISRAEIDYIRGVNSQFIVRICSCAGSLKRWRIRPTSEVSSISRRWSSLRIWACRRSRGYRIMRRFART